MLELERCSADTQLGVRYTHILAGSQDEEEVLFVFIEVI